MIRLMGRRNICCRPGSRRTWSYSTFHRVKEKEEVVLVEGSRSVFRLHQLGLPAIALTNRTLPDEQEELLASTKLKRLVLMMDGDDPGRQGQAELLPLLARKFFTRVVELPEGQQPDTVEEEFLSTPVQGAKSGSADIRLTKEGENNLKII